MLTLGHQKIDTLTLAVMVVVLAAATALCLAAPALTPWVFLALAVAALVLYWSMRWEITIFAWLWVLSYGLLEWPQWKVELTNFFNMTVPRFIFIGMLVAFFLHFMLRRRAVRYDRGILWVMLALVAYCAISATATGWVAKTEEVKSAPYFRFLASMVFPFIVFFLVYNATRSEKQIRWGLILLTIYGWYALYIGYLQYASIMAWPGARALIWPPYINDPSYGIHFERARGAFSAAGPQGLFLVLLFYVDLFLIRRVRGPYRAAVIAQTVLVPPAIFFTGIRASYVAFFICGIIWCILAGRERFGKGKLAIAILAVAIGSAVFWENLITTKREIGGVAQRGPIVSRFVLVSQTWEIFKQSPLVGVGFGHFVDAQQELARDPASAVGMTTGVLVEHNLFLNMAAETGVVGLAATVLIFVLLLRQSRQLYRKLPETAAGDLSRDFVVLFWVVLANFLTTAMFRDTLWDVFANGIFWTLAGLMVGYNRLLEPHQLDLPVTASDVAA